MNDEIKWSGGKKVTLILSKLMGFFVPISTSYQGYIATTLYRKIYTA